MDTRRHLLLGVALLSISPLLAAAAHGASATQVSRATWAGSASLPSYVSMYIYVPDKLAAKPPIVVSAHSCGSSATGQVGNIPKTLAAADKNGFIVILPDNPGQNCWDVGSTKSLTHDGGGDTQAVAQMVKYALSKYGGDPGRVYIFGGSSGAMLTQAMLAVYPDLFRAGSARAGVPAGCWADGYDSSQQWSNTCAAGSVSKTAQQWGDLVRKMDPGYTGHRPRVQLFQGESDTTISYNNTGESIKEWTNVLGLGTNPTSSDTGYKAANATYDRKFWSNACGYTVLQAWSSPGGTHSMPYEDAEILKFFGLDVASDTDSEPDCSGSTGAGGAGGAGGQTASGGHAGSAGGIGGHATGGAAGATSTGGSPGTGGSPATGGVSGGSGGGAPPTTGTGGHLATGGSPGSDTGGTTSTGGASGTGTGGSSSPGGNNSGGGCSYAPVSGGEAALSILVLLALAGLTSRRRRRT
jgi:poly(hydroxyalkanoate) depolymerase family esterase